MKVWRWKLRKEKQEATLYVQEDDAGVIQSFWGDNEVLQIVRSLPKVPVRYGVMNEEGTIEDGVKEGYSHVDLILSLLDAGWNLRDKEEAKD